MQKQLKNYNNKELVDMLATYQGLMDKAKTTGQLSSNPKIVTPALSRSESTPMNVKDIQVAIDLIKQHIFQKNGQPTSSGNLTSSDQYIL